MTDRNCEHEFKNGSICPKCGRTLQEIIKDCLTKKIVTDRDLGDEDPSSDLSDTTGYGHGI